MSDIFMPNSDLMFPSGGGGSDWEDAVNALSPSAWWRLGETSGTTAADENTTYDGTYIATPTLNQTSLIVGDSNPSIRLDGSTEFVDMGDVLDPDSGDYSVVIWVNLDTIKNHRPIQKRGTGGFGTQPGWQIGLSDGGGGKVISNSGIEATNGAYAALGSSQIPDFGISTGTTYMITMTWSNSNERLRMYRDETLLATGVVTGTIAGQSVSTTRPLTIGCADNDGSESQFWDGFVDEALIFKGTELTSTQISGLYLAGS